MVLLTAQTSPSLHYQLLDIKRLRSNTMQKHKWSSLSTVVILATLILISSFFASVVQRSGGRVDVQTIKFPTQNGQLLVADLFKPKTATQKNPAPLVIVIPGFQRSKETQSPSHRWATLHRPLPSQ